MMASLHFSHDRLKFFVRPVVPQDTLFFLLEETDPSASVVLLAAVNPKASWRHGARNMLFNCGPMLGTHPYIAHDSRHPPVGGGIGGRSYGLVVPML